MALYIRSEEADQLARELAARTGKTITEAVTEALRAALSERPAPVHDREARIAAIMAIGARSAALPERDPRDHGDVLYDENGLPK
jgi:antitoxin VapB